MGAYIIRRLLLIIPTPDHGCIDGTVTITADGVPQAELLVPLVFAIIIGTVVPVSISSSRGRPESHRRSR